MKKHLHRLLLLTMFFVPLLTRAQVVECPTIDTLPYFNDFENEADGSYDNAFPYCWTRINDAITYNEYPYIVVGNVNVIHGNKSLFWKSHPSPHYADDIYAVLPALNQVFDSLSGFTMSFYAKTTDTVAPFPIIIIGVMTANDDTNSFVPVDTVTVGPAVTLYTVDFSNYSGEGKYIAIRCPRTSVERYASIDDIYLNLTSQWCNRSRI